MRELYPYQYPPELQTTHTTEICMWQWYILIKTWHSGWKNPTKLKNKTKHQKPIQAVIIFYIKATIQNTKEGRSDLDCLTHYYWVSISPLKLCLLSQLTTPHAVRLQILIDTGTVTEVGTNKYQEAKEDCSL